MTGVHTISPNGSGATGLKYTGGDREPACIATLQLRHTCMYSKSLKPRVKVKVSKISKVIQK